MLNAVFRPLLGKYLCSGEMVDVFDSVNRLARSAISVLRLTQADGRKNTFRQQKVNSQCSTPSAVLLVLIPSEL